MGRLPSNDVRIVFWPNTRRSVAGYKTPKATDFDDPLRDWSHLDNDWRHRAYAMRTMQSTMHKW